MSYAVEVRDRFRHRRVGVRFGGGGDDGTKSRPRGSWASAVWGRIAVAGHARVDRGWLVMLSGTGGARGIEIVIPGSQLRSGSEPSFSPAGGGTGVGGDRGGPRSRSTGGQIRGRTNPGRRRTRSLRRRGRQQGGPAQGRGGGEVRPAGSSKDLAEAGVRLRSYSPRATSPGDAAGPSSALDSTVRTDLRAAV